MLLFSFGIAPGHWGTQATSPHEGTHQEVEKRGVAVMSLDNNSP